MTGPERSQGAAAASDITIISFGPSFVGKIVEAGTIDHLSAISADDRDLLHTTTTERRDLALDQRLAFESNQAFRPVVAEMSHAATATSGENNRAPASVDFAVILTHDTDYHKDTLPAPVRSHSSGFLY